MYVRARPRPRLDSLRPNTKASSVHISGVVTRGRGRTAPGDTLQGGDTRRKKILVGKFTKNSGETRSDR